ncbi:hypothetical protein RhiirA4_487353 [Rhizophagus irregularis]|uniref:RRM domain-containing protein n=1 Tax=Rhizophagus irregularis TaxID=588596 RepID=A0A2I1HSI3_9GLOM|nr:hypothetical protein RhiirA4_487353 [Rhizophagus irregularis]
MGKNNKKSKTSVKKPSSYIPTQEFVDKFTAAFQDILRHMLTAVEYHSKEEYTAKVIKPLVSGGDLVKPVTLADTYNVGPLTSEVFYGIISGARLKARQQLDSLSSRYQNSLPSLAKKLHPQQGNKGKQKDQSNQHVLLETYANPVIDESMNIDETADPSVAASQPNQEGDSRSTQSTSSNPTPIGTSPPNVVTQSEDKIKKSKVTRLTVNNNVVHTTQQGQVRTIMIYDIPSAWSHDDILNKLSAWGKVLEISFKPQHRFQSVWVKIILRPLLDTEFIVTKTWCQSLGGFYVRWFPGHWKLKDRKERERFQAKIKIPGDATDQQLFGDYYKGRPFIQFLSTILKAKSYLTILDKEQKYVILYFESQKDLHAALEVEQTWSMTVSQTPFQKKSYQSGIDKKKNLKSLKGKKAEPKSSTSSNKSRDKSKKLNNMNDDTRSLLKLILNLLT